ncbi:uncharacterized protein LOC135204262 [Macrobrachium nipponense]|uniref:uncharacterized protein LOC135204262 n=1 Tax=Macrobrachium nipponense TaxID=159736 RepID=UPI0030C83817
MKLLIFICALVAAEADKLDGLGGYTPPRHGSTDVTLSSLIRSDGAGHHSSTAGSTRHSAGQQPSAFSSVGVGQQPSAFSSAGVGQQPSPFSSVGVGQQPSAFSSVGVGRQPSAFSTTGVGRQPSAFGTGGLFGVHAHVHAHHSPTGNGQQQAFQQTSFGSSGIRHSGTTSGHLRGSAPFPGKCPDGQVRHFDGRCVTPEISRKYLVYTEPEKRARKLPAPPVDVPLPKLEYNYLFIRTQEKDDDEADHIVIPPPQQKHVIYVLNKEAHSHERELIEVPQPEQHNPEVFFVNYAEGETPTLPDGIDFNTALNSAIPAESHVIDNSGELGLSPGRGDLASTHFGTGLTAVTGSHSGSHSSEEHLGVDVRGFGSSGTDSHFTSSLGDSTFGTPAGSGHHDSSAETESGPVFLGTASLGSQAGVRGGTPSQTYGTP